MVSSIIVWSKPLCPRSPKYTKYLKTIGIKNSEKLAESSILWYNISMKQTGFKIITRVILLTMALTLLILGQRESYSMVTTAAFQLWAIMLTILATVWLDDIV